MFLKEFENRAIGAIRYLGLKAIQIAQGGHVGMTISAAPITFTLFTKFINLNPNDGKWINRDRFILSGGHGSMSLYPIFYLAKMMKQKDLKNFKVEDSHTPGHPEYEDLKNNFIDASTGPLGQGLAMGVGMALAQKHAALQCPELFTNYTYVLCGDGDFQEGISYEAMAIAGKYQLDRLIVLHDSNQFQLDSAVSDVSIENLELRARSNNWFYLKCSNEPQEIEKSILKAQKSKKPALIEVETIIAEGLAIGNTNKGHHGVIDDQQLDAFQKYHQINFQDWNIDQDIIDYFVQTVNLRGQKAFQQWNQKYEKYQKKLKNKKMINIINNQFDYQKLFKQVKIKHKDLATRAYLKEFLNSLVEQPLAIATCADLAASTNVLIGHQSFINGGQSLPLGIREFAMGAIINGMTLYGCGYRLIGGTFLVFADYMKSAIRLGCLMKLPSIYAFTHDSYLVGGDGPTHQPYDQLPMLRSIEHLNVYRPADEEELRYALILAYSSKKESSALILSRQNIPSLNQKIKLADMKKGAYVVLDCKNPDYVIAASGSEVGLALKVAQGLKKTKVVSVPCLDRAVNLDQKELEQLFRAKKAFLTLEASADYKWYKLHLEKQKNLHWGAYQFGKSMDGNKLYQDLGFDPKFIIKMLKAI